MTYLKQRATGSSVALQFIAFVPSLSRGRLCRNRREGTGRQLREL